MNYAQIQDGVVVNVIYIHPAQEAEFPDCVPLDDIPACIGDIYTDGKFYRDGEEVKSAIQLLMESEDVLNILLGGGAE